MYTQAQGSKLPVILFDFHSTVSSCKEKAIAICIHNTNSISDLFFVLGFRFPCIRNMEIIQHSYLFDHFGVVSLSSSDPPTRLDYSIKKCHALKLYFASGTKIKRISTLT